MDKKFIAALTFTVFSGTALAATGATSTSTQGVVGAGPAIPFATLDTNGDKALSKDELQRVPTLGGNFDKLDFNGDGKIIEADYYAIMAAVDAGRAPALPEYMSLDVNHDGAVDQSEYDAFKQRLTEIDKLMLSGEIGPSAMGHGSTTANPIPAESSNSGIQGTTPPSGLSVPPSSVPPTPPVTP